MTVVIAKPGQANKNLSVKDIGGKTISEIKEHIKTEDNIFLVTPFYTKILDDEDIPLELFPELLLAKPPKKYIRPQYYLSFLGNKQGTTFLFHVNCRNFPNFPPCPINFIPSELTTILCKDIFTMFKNRFPFQFTDGHFTIDDSDVDPSLPARDLFEKLAKSPITFHCVLGQKVADRYERRTTVLEEVLSTEETYIKDLKNINEYWEPAIAGLKCLDKDDYNTVFQDIQSIIFCQEMFYESLKSRGTQFSSVVSDVFIEFSNFFKATKTYVSNFQTITNILNKKILKSKSNAKVLDKLAANNADCPGRDLASYLITPVQRMPRYKLFLRELLKYTPEFHPDYELLVTAENMINDVTREFDTETKNTNNFVQLLKSKTATQCVEISKLRMQLTKLTEENKKLKAQKGVNKVPKRQNSGANAETDEGSMTSRSKSKDDFEMLKTNRPIMSSASMNRMSTFVFSDTMPLSDSPLKIFSRSMNDTKTDFVKILTNEEMRDYFQVSKLKDSEKASKVRKGIRGQVFVKKLVQIRKKPHFEKLLEILNKRHPCLTTVYEFGGDDAPASIEELLTSNILESYSTLSLVRKSMIVIEVAFGMRFLSENGVIHRNLKLQNVLLNDLKHAKLCDFGLSQVESLEEILQQSQDSLIFMAPEVLKNMEHNQKVDIYAFGVFLYFMAVGTLPELTVEQIKNCERIPPPSNVKEFVTELIFACTSPEPRDRPAFSVILYTIKVNNFSIFDGVDSEFLAERYTALERFGNESR